MDTIKVTELGKGSKVVLKNGWVATLMDGYKKRSTRLAFVEGLFDEMGSIYASDIAFADINGELFKVEVPESMVSIWH
jgi:hypothetical protein